MIRLYKKLFFLMAASGLFLLTSCSSGGTTQQSSEAEDTASKGVAEATFEKTSHDFGKIFSGERVSFAFNFTNTGDSPLVITNTRSGCGCTVGEYSKEPIAPGSTGRINVLFNSAGRNGFQSETIRISTNADPSEHLLRISAEVIRE
ncbi:MAG: DUF1573 domain-containing protein [Bacteroidales bacterium]